MCFSTTAHNDDQSTRHCDEWSDVQSTSQVKDDSKYLKTLTCANQKKVITRCREAVPRQSRAVGGSFKFSRIELFCQECMVKHKQKYGMSVPKDANIEYVDTHPSTCTIQMGSQPIGCGQTWTSMELSNTLNPWHICILWDVAMKCMS
eukprot:4537820-Amphidinium_carterae.1